MAAWLNRWLLFSVIPLGILFTRGEKYPVSSTGPLKAHPFHVSVVEIDHNAAEKSLEISCKIFTDDFEKALTQNYKAKVDLINPTDRKAMDSLVKKYILSHLSIAANGKLLSCTYVGFEHDNDAVLGYFEVDNIPSVQKITINNTVMYDFFTDQVNLMHVVVGGNRKSTKLEYPAKEAIVTFP